MNAPTDPRQFLYRAGLDPDAAQALTADALARADDGELYLQYRKSEAFGFDDGRLKTASYDTHAGFGLRAVSGETTAFAHANDISEGAIRRAAETMTLLDPAKGGKLGRPCRSLGDMDGNSGSARIAQFKCPMDALQDERDLKLIRAQLGRRLYKHVCAHGFAGSSRGCRDDRAHLVPLVPFAFGPEPSIGEMQRLLLGPADPSTVGHSDRDRNSEPGVRANGKSALSIKGNLERKSDQGCDRQAAHVGQQNRARLRRLKKHRTRKRKGTDQAIARRRDCSVSITGVTPISSISRARHSDQLGRLAWGGAPRRANARSRSKSFPNDPASSSEKYRMFARHCS
jgi:hypothetical protein